MQVLGIPVDVGLIAQWFEWLMPEEQPYLVPQSVARNLHVADDRGRLTPELRDSFSLYGIEDDQLVCWLTRAEAQGLPPDVRRSQRATHRWRRHDGTDTVRIVRSVENGRRPSRHTEVDQAVWDRIEQVLPCARRLVGTFPTRSGPNCFGTVMGAAGVGGAAEAWMQQAPFEEWLAAETRDGGSDDEPGTVLLWRGRDGLAQHAAVTLGGGWALHKPSQGWMSPIQILTVRDVKFASRCPGLYLHRRSLEH
ncbi:hypothetical protein [Nakamurella lactea]|uniref:hypothetical protein n=1 Tax=Nakamurella lactea TaxID=459515 RepID=UPI0004251B2F|nr:hypothetical protein [Nakamurella lactea]